MPITTEDASVAPVPRRWRPTGFVACSLALHAALAALCIAWPALWRWWLAALAANHAIVCTLVFIPRNRALGANLTRLPPQAAAQGMVALSFDDGPDPEVTPRVLDMLDAAGASASFFCIGRRVQQHPELLRDMLARGHGVENHGYAHSSAFALFWPARMARDILDNQQAIWRATGTWPRFFRPTAGFRNPMLDRVLAACGLHLATWTRRGFDTRCTDAQRVTRRLLRGLRAGDILLLHDGNAARDAQGQPLVLSVLPALLHALQARGLRGVHLQAFFSPPSTPRTP